ncbi:MAG TPA: GNAT family N-acetyltransferase [Sulfurimonas sp.]|uniref:GNAT family N-acetyltransferase n=1 Tax=Sulfurimonas sp. TaxID=2022749 RepID=UPI002CB743DB|nr:GNAT family N-acetyltransferase [Sulfurimonas sp.]HUH42597.1 GNAT family N-acetyltransferase [Sulfurimonas sp.]
MQIRELDLKELQMAYEVLSELRTTLSYDEFEDLIYEMRSIEYKMFGVMDGEKLITYAGVAIQTNLYDKRHLFIFDLVTSQRFRAKGYASMMLEYLNDYAKMGMCKNIVLSSGFQREDAHKFYENSGFVKKSFVFIKSV